MTMKTIHAISMTVLLGALAACGGGGDGGGAGAVKVVCMDLHEQGTPTACAASAAAQGIALSALEAREVDLGQVQRGVQARLEAGVENATPFDFDGIIQYWTNLDCAGRTEPWIMAEGGFPIRAGGTEFGGVSLECGDSTAGAKWFRIDILTSDRVTLVDQITGNFRLVE
jgi:hypothetical protein